MWEIVSLALSIVGQVMDKMPDYEQGKREKYYELLRELDEEKKKPIEFRDDERLADLHDELRTFLRVFFKEISSKGL